MKFILLDEENVKIHKSAAKQLHNHHDRIRYNCEIAQSCTSIGHMCTAKRTKVYHHCSMRCMPAHLHTRREHKKNNQLPFMSLGHEILYGGRRPQARYTQRKIKWKLVFPHIVSYDRHIERVPHAFARGVAIGNLLPAVSIELATKCAPDKDPRMPEFCWDTHASNKILKRLHTLH